MRLAHSARLEIGAESRDDVPVLDHARRHPSSWLTLALPSPRGVCGSKIDALLAVLSRLAPE